MISESRARIAGRIDGLLNVDDAAFRAAGDALFFLLQASRQHYIRISRGFGKEEIGDAEKNSSFSSASRVNSASGSETAGLKQIENSALISPAWIAFMIS